MRVIHVIPIVALLFVSVAHAQDSAGTPITGPELDRLTRDWPEVMAWSDRQNDQLGSLKASPSLLAQYAAGAGLLGLLQSKGWQPDRFFDVAGRASAALMRIQMEEQMPDLIAEFAQQKEAIEANPGLTRQQKDELLANMDLVLQSIAGIADTLPVTDEEVQLVRARRADLQPLFE